MQSLYFATSIEVMGYSETTSFRQLQLTERQRAVCVRYYGRDMSQREIGAELGITQQATSDSILAARKRYPALRRRYVGRR